uniref:HEAT repeat domain-containing protein n=1 Tax=Altererythrobacter segetis TaxID=1104773 RepID=UPI00140E7704|nr:HEAT repeat domain-containing protein [Altererythrobacter segetis]
MATLNQAFADPNPSVRLNAALKAGINPSLLHLDTLLEQCAVEPDFQVREMLTWALIRLPAEIVVPKLIGELSRKEAQARGQALHTLSKFRDPSAWQAVAAMLDDEDERVMRTAWYASVALVPEGQRKWLAEKLASRLGSGDEETQLSLSRAIVGLGHEASMPILGTAIRRGDDDTRVHALATERLFHDPNVGFAISLKAARKQVALGQTRSSKG